MNTGVVDLHSNGIYLELLGTQIAQIKIPSDYVPYTFAPIIDQHMLISGDKLQNGMLVVLEDTGIRANPNQLSPEYPDRKHGFVPSEYDRRRVEETARWALVTDVKIRSNGADSRVVKFTAIYSDGTMRDRTYNVDYKWAVLREYDVLPVCTCGKVHTGEEIPADIDEMTRRVTSMLFGEEMSFEEFTQKTKEDGFVDEVFDRTLNFGLSSFFGSLPELLESDSDEDDVENERREDETEDEHLDRLRDEAEARGEYDSNEKLQKLRDKLQQPIISLSDPIALAALRAKLRGE